MKKKIGIITWHYHSNFGSALQAYALQYTLCRLGTDAEFINYHKPKYGRSNRIKNLLKIAIDSTLGLFSERFRFASVNFGHKYIRVGELTMDENRLQDLSKKYDIIVCGSDQIWAPNLFDPIYFASFAPPKTRKISYAASIGLNAIPANLVEKYKDYLKDFYAISIREQEGKQLLSKFCGIESTVVLDPTLLNDGNFYRGIQRKVYGIKEPYIFCYFLNDKHNYRNKVEEFAQKHGLKVIGVSLNDNDDLWMNRYKKMGADHFIWLINHAEYIFTDSYHGSIFSLLLHKRFWTFKRFEETDVICQNSRIRQLKDYFDDNVRILADKDEIDESLDLDYNKFEADLKPLREKSLDFLKKALN